MPIGPLHYLSTMTDAVDDLRSAVAQAITDQLPADVDESQLPRDVAIHLTADRLVRDALAAGHAGNADITEVTAFGAGNTAMIVARVHANMAYVVKVDTSPTIVKEAHLLRRMATDPSLPVGTRAAFPRVFAIDDTPPLFGYLMELVEDAEPIHLSLRRQDSDAARLVTALWSSVLEPAYDATRSPRLAHNLHDDYFVRARSRLLAAAEAGALPKPDQPIVVNDGSKSVAFDGGWGDALDQAMRLLHDVRPSFGTWVHGDPNPENALWSKGSDGDVNFRLLDPKDWWTGDYLFDVAKLGHYAVITAPTEAGLLSVDHTTDLSRIEYDETSLAWGRSVERSLLDQVAAFAAKSGDEEWARRYLLAFGANLLGIAGPRAQKAAMTGDAAQADLTAVALGAGLMALGQADALK